MFVLGITGGIGCGKSTFSNFFREAGVKVVDADAISHVVTAVGGSALDELRLCLPATCFQADGSLEREQVAALVFNDKTLLDQISLIIHEQVINEIQKEVEAAKQASLPLIVLDVPLPVQHGFLDLSDFVLVIWANEDVRIERLQQRGLAKLAAKQRIACQMTKEEYAKLANLTIDNSVDLAALKQKFSEFVEQELNSRGIFL
ncbi:dephospho-CoA kinase [Amygdalobacter nucleatus]|uniref:dephospho-CoA kinase n=1 Tax=Amygdalobacter nucleatus TaxID=3029274 RepID=UPI0027A2FAE2|nr:dephospho-CoA kinase [Amygdalobacter nucleatus]WEG36552.1 dephospho-CoA kinase [Amygdalobacter nucleatus]